MKQGIYTVTGHEALTKDVYRMALAGDTSAMSAPGQFVEISLPGFFLRRPISVCDYDASGLVLIYKVVGRGTEAMAAMKEGEKLDIITGLGNGFSPEKGGEMPLLVGGGVGVPPLYHLAKRLIAQGSRPFVVLGFNKAEEIFYAKEFEALGAEVAVTTVDGSAGVKGFATAALPGSFSYVYSCGPMPMLRALYLATQGTAGEFSLEERMGCGFGACMGCSIMTKKGSRRVCKDGPVFEKEELAWQI
ncbi:dihydroorotate dehydrogenase electron transfer subunit [Mailhella massiliensis]|uniref:Dihydroorotate dehydrogenase B (NAD(+)), electron transfer subunit n=1 Tax=Mailhella massiliensis TaxID=1903261 RepID=A0A921AV50_9BACT|nr:dihydroorotate dehydrogenase electron transfer subunit [Mailhella massiliensis]HJD96466.1 dihydroorotate dehydrogenase electron transfer subunit [Mailhella massiliensis]